MVQTGSKKWSKRGQNLGPKKCPEMGQKSGPNGVKKVVQTGSKFGYKKVSRNGSKKVAQTGSKFESKRGQILTPETDVQKLGSRNDIRGRQSDKREDFVFSFVFLIGTCLLAARARSYQSRSQKRRLNTSDRQMIVDNNSEPKNNNASLQSNN